MAITRKRPATTTAAQKPRFRARRGVKPPAKLAAIVRRVSVGERPRAVGSDDYPVVSDDPLRDAHLLLDGYLRRAQGYLGADAARVPAATKILAAPPARLAEVVRAALARLTWAASYEVRDRKTGRFEPIASNPGYLIGALLGRLYAKRPPLADDDFVALCTFGAGRDGLPERWEKVHGPGLLKLLVARLGRQPAPEPAHATALEAVLDRWRQLWAAEARALPFERNQKPLRLVEGARAAGGW